MPFPENQSYRECMRAVKRDGWEIRFVEKQTPELCLLAIQQDPFSLEYVRAQTPEMCVLAYTLDPRVSGFIQDAALRAALEGLIPRKEE